MLSKNAKNTKCAPNVTFCEFQINQYAAVGLNRDTFTMLSLQCKMQISIFPDKNDSVVIIVSA